MEAANQEWLGRIGEIVEARVGLRFEGHRQAFLAARLDERRQAERLESFEALHRRLSAERIDQPLWRSLIDSLVTNETSWFRYPDHFEALRRYLLPAILSNKAFEGEGEIRILSAGCSLGQEPYSIAIAALECPEAAGGPRIRVTALDICDEGLERARRGEYREHELRGLCDERRARHFRQSGEIWKVSPEARAMVQFRRHNLLDPIDMGLFDVIFCRNVTIYFKPQTTRKVLLGLLESLRPGGRLFIGHAETCHDLALGLRPVQFGKALLYRKPNLTVEPDIRRLAGAAPAESIRLSEV